MKVFSHKVLKSCLLAALLMPALSTAAIIGPGLQEKIDNPASSVDSRISVVVFLDNEGTRNLISKVSSDLPRSQRAIQVVRELKSFRSPYLSGVTDFVRNNGGEVLVEHWVAPAVTVELPVAAIETLAGVTGVRRVVENVSLLMSEPVEVRPATTFSTATSSALEMMNVPELWNQGLTGSGRLVCSFDTGIEFDHPGLGSKWRGLSSPLSSSWFSMVSADEPPADASGHGTHTMGIMVGSVGDDKFGVAPDAEWIGAGVIDQGHTLAMTISDIIEAFGWALDPDGDPNTTDDMPDVILNSWGLPRGMFEPCDDTFFEVIDNVEAAGIVTIFAAGNEGPTPSTIRSPADRASSPLNSFSVGAVDNSSNITSFSSRGPSSCNGEIKPEVVAPGVSIRSSYKGGGFSYMTGTSMAAPYVAGLVALMRQYNPEATVEELKRALISAATDLGIAGEDNDYGHGLIDASRLISYLPVPANVFVEIADYEIDGGFLLPGSEFGLHITLNHPGRYLEMIEGQLISISGIAVDLTNDRATFFFGNSAQSANIMPFVGNVDRNVQHGENLDFVLLLNLPGTEVFDTLFLQVPVGVSMTGMIGVHRSQKLSFAVSNFGQFGFSSGSIYNLGGEGLRVGTGDNLLYEAGIIIGRSGLQLASSIRDAQGLYAPSDFAPEGSLIATTSASSASTRMTTTFTDQGSAIPIPITVQQQTISYEDEADGVLLMEYTLINETLEYQTNLNFGLVFDLDMSAGLDRLTLDELSGMIYQSGVDGPMVGVVALENIRSFNSYDNGNSKRGFTNEEKYQMVTDSGIAVDAEQVGDLMFVASAGSFALAANESVRIAVAVIVGNSVEELRQNALLARDRHMLATSAGDDAVNLLPQSVELEQNYPNPFNPSTMISFSIPSAQEVRLEVINLLGQTVSTLRNGIMEAGSHSVTWDAVNDRGQQVASGIYFYRLTAKESSQTRKMVLLQ